MSNFIEIENTCKAAAETAGALAVMPAVRKNEMLDVARKALLSECAAILKANEKDVKAAEAAGKAAHFIDRLRLTEKRVQDMADGIKQIIALQDPIGGVLDKFTASKGLEVTKVRVPLGVVGIIYEARPNVTADCIALCIKSGNCVVLRGSKDAYNSNAAIVTAVKNAFVKNKMPADCVQLIKDTSREGAESFMRQNNYLDVLIPRGGAELIKSVVENATVPVIETGTGNCHIYVEKTADIDMAAKIAVSAKISRPSVCNAAESLLIDKAVAKKALPVILTALAEKGVKIKGCSETMDIILQDYTTKVCQKKIDIFGEKSPNIFDNLTAAVEEDYYTEFLDLVISVKVVKDITEAVAHINKYGTKHSDAIITTNEKAAEYFLNNVDSAAVYVNASTRFTDGGEFGFGAEMGISTQKLHARGPVGLKELTSYKYLVRGNGQVR